MHEIITTLSDKFPFIYWKFRYLKYILRKNKFKIMGLEEKKKYLNKIYNKIFNYDINWNSPKKFTEKIQYIKLFGKNNEIQAILADKYLVRDWIKEKIGEEYLIPLIGVYDKFSDINFDDLPNSFVIKCNHDSGSVTVVKDKNKVDWKKLRYKYDYHVKTNFYYFTLESHYSLIQPKIIIEQYLETSNEDVPDYKFLCFNGEPCYCWVDTDRFIEHKRNLYDLDWNLMDWQVGKYKKNKKIIKPNNFNEMLDLVKNLCIDIPHVRVDLYDINGKIYFGEMTFTSESGFGYIDPNHDLMLGNLWKIKDDND